MKDKKNKCSKLFLVSALAEKQVFKIVLGVGIGIMLPLHSSCLLLRGWRGPKGHWRGCWCRCHHPRCCRRFDGFLLYPALLELILAELPINPPKRTATTSRVCSVPACRFFLLFLTAARWSPTMLSQQRSIASLYWRMAVVLGAVLFVSPFLWHVLAQWGLQMNAHSSSSFSREEKVYVFAPWILKSGGETRGLSLFVGFLAAWAVNQASVQSGGLHVKCTCSRPIRKFVYVIARVARGGVIPFKRNVFIGCSRYCEPGWSRGSCHDVVQTESSFGVIFVTFVLSNFFKWLFGWVEITVMARQSIGLMHRCSADVARDAVRCCRRRLWREITWMVIVRTPPWRFCQG